MSRASFFQLRSARIVSWLFLVFTLGCVVPGVARANFAPRLAWNASGDSSVTGYKLYWGTVNRQFTNSFLVGNRTDTVVPGLSSDTLYFFAATSVDGAGNESDFSNVTAYQAENVFPGALLKVATLPAGISTNPVVFSLDANAPPGASIDPITGVFSWTPGNAFASTTNLITVHVADTVNPGQSLVETLVVVVGDYLNFKLGTAAVLANQTGSLSLTIAASGVVTNLHFALTWPADLLNPALSLASPLFNGSVQLQGGVLVGKVTVIGGTDLTGGLQVGQINFQAPAKASATAVYKPVFTTANGSSVGGQAYVNVWTQPGEVVVVGDRAFLRPQTASTGRVLSLYANPGTYQVWYATSLVPPVNWQSLMTYTQTNAMQSISLDQTLPNAYYRVQELSSPVDQSASVPTW